VNELYFARDVRVADPDQSAHRLARFRDGWRNAVSGQSYTERTLSELTWENLGYRLGKLFGETSPLLIDLMYEWCVHQQAKR
jgi:hypothetical protein